ncbi:MAG: hypothetical protein HZC45_02010 [Deltaproteobacteria bacterium]|nr:hypothetical protein [Deltaproteobacteria bacterium]
MTVPSPITKNILELYNRHISPGKTIPNNNSYSAPSKDIATISEEGKKHIMERLKNEAISHLVSKG